MGGIQGGQRGTAHPLFFSLTPGPFEEKTGHND